MQNAKSAAHSRRYGYERIDTDFIIVSKDGTILLPKMAGTFCRFRTNRGRNILPFPYKMRVKHFAVSVHLVIFAFKINKLWIILFLNEKSIRD